MAASTLEKRDTAAPRPAALWEDDGALGNG